VTVLARVALALAAAAALFPSVLAASPRAEESPTDLRESLRQATVRAIELEIDAYTAKLQAAGGSDASAETAGALRETIAGLEAERERFRSMPTAEYPAPVADEPDPASVLDEATARGPVVPARCRPAVVVPTGPYADGSLLEVEGTSRSGPFYHLAGVVGGDPRILEAGRRTRVTLYLVYRREYFGFIGDWYVTIGR
jgi:hypothetical protein